MLHFEMEKYPKKTNHPHNSMLSFSLFCISICMLMSEQYGAFAGAIICAYLTYPSTPPSSFNREKILYVKSGTYIHYIKLMINLIGLEPPTQPIIDITHSLCNKLMALKE